uniref:peptide chain release factor N(5)-glutamine methyltransferase n=2 Tax=Cyprinus carpio TaxID=7962 RepID=A0A8C1DWZ2_CYPCA
TMFKTIWFLNRLLHRNSGVSKHRGVVRLWSNAAEGAVAPPADCSITAEQAIRCWAQHFTLHGISEPLLSSQYIISHVLGEKTLECVQRKRLRDTLTDRERESVWELCSKRLTRMPVQYVIEEWDFRDLTLKMRPPVFIPRPETEELVSLVLEDSRLIQGESHRTDLRCLEVGCGSGAISLSLLHSIPQLRVFALDQSQTAVCLTMENANRLGLQDRLEVHLLDVIKDADVILSKCNPVDFLISNPPYLLSQDMKTLQTEILKFEDHSALDGGLDGLSVIRPILALSSKLLTPRGRVYLEVAPCHPPIIQQLIEEMMPGLLYLETRCDLTNRPRFCILQKKGEDG